MKLTDIVVSDAIITDLKADQRDDVVAEMVDALIAAGVIEADHRQTIIDSVLSREKKGSTGFGRGVAVPHVKHDSARGLSAAIGLSKGGIDFNALDQEPVYIVFLLLSPADNPEEHLQAMEVIFKNLSNEVFRRFLRQATTVDDVTTLLDEADNNQLGG